MLRFLLTFFMVHVLGSVGISMLKPAHAGEEALVTVKVMSPDLAMKMAQAALEACRERDLQVAVSVVDRFGVVQVTIRDRYAGAHTPDTALRKAWTAVSFRTDTRTLQDISEPGAPSSGVRFVTNALMIGGGVPVEAGGTLVGGIGVSGAPTGELDEACARDGIAAVSDVLDF